MLKRMWAVAYNTFLETYRSQTMWVIFVYLVVMVAASQLFSYVTIVERSRIIIDIGLASLELFCVFISLFVGINLVAQEMNNKTIYTLLSKPLRRSEFILGKYMGLSLISMVTNSIMFLLLAGYLTVWGIPLNSLYIVCNVHLLLELFVLNAVILALSSLSSPILTGLLSLGAYLIGQTANSVKEIMSVSKHAAVVFIADVIYAIVPNMTYFNSKNAVVHGHAFQAFDIWLPFAFAALYIAFFLFIAVMAFAKKHVK